MPERPYIDQDCTLAGRMRVRKDGADCLGVGAMFPGMGINGLAVISAILARPDIGLAAELKGIFIQALTRDFVE